MRVQGTGTLLVDVVLRGRSTGVVEAFPVAGHMGAHQPLELSYTPSDAYPGGGWQGLADGRRGSEDFRDGAWQAVQGQDMTCTVDLGQPTSIQSLETQFYLYQDAWIFLPKRCGGPSLKTGSLSSLRVAPLGATPWHQMLGKQWCL